MRAAILTALLFLGGAACGNSPSKGDCEKLRDHLVELEAAAAGGGAMPPEQKPDLEQQKKKVRESVSLDFCLKDMSIDQVECGLKARTLDELQKTCNKS